MAKDYLFKSMITQAFAYLFNLLITPMIVKIGFVN
jgi:hypothetical protein